VRTAAEPWGLRVELCAPERRNALDPQSVADLREAFSDDGPGPVLLCAEGPVFCAGGDIDVLAEAAAQGDLTDLLVPNAAAFADVIEAIVTCPRPVVVAVDGPAVGGGASLVLAADVRLATPRARLVFGWGRWGLPPDGCITATLAAAVGPELAQSLLAESAEIGTDSELASLVFTHVVPAQRFEEEVLATVTALADAPEARAAKAATAAALLPVLRARREEELAAIARAAADKGTGERLANLYKIER
jgi:2-(1,2-epoxy-1,2-dihydrophenyl)acetyl-CoA isomerase